MTLPRVLLIGACLASTPAMAACPTGVFSRAVPACPWDKISKVFKVCPNIQFNQIKKACQKNHVQRESQDTCIALQKSLLIRKVKFACAFLKNAQASQGVSQPIQTKPATTKQISGLAANHPTTTTTTTTTTPKAAEATTTSPILDNMNKAASAASKAIRLILP